MLTFLGQKYGHRPLPAKILATKFDLMLEAISDAKDKELLNHWFYLDENSVTPVYVLQPITVHLPHFNDNAEAEKRENARKVWREQFIRMQVVLTKAAREKLSLDDAKKYFISVTEDEIHNGILETDSPNKHCFWFRRNIDNLLEVAGNSKDISESYIDIARDDVDAKATKLLEDLKDNLQHTLEPERILEYDVKLDAEKGIDPTSCSEHEKYIDKLCTEFQEKLKENIKQGIRERETIDNTDPLYEEIFQQTAICQEKCERFHGRRQELDAIEEYLNTPSNQSPLVVYGQSGSGKTSLIAMAARRCNGNERRAAVMRFLGTTQRSCNIRTVLISLCQQICKIYENYPCTIPNDFDKLTKFFADLLHNANASKSLVVFLDSLDNLAEDYGARELAWLPLTLPPHVKLVVSTLPDEKYQCFPILKIAIPNEKSFIQVPQLSTAESTEILESWLKNGGRSMTENQKDHVAQTFKKCSLPLFVKLAFDEVFQWKSYSSKNECVLQATVGAAIASVFEKLEYRHGKLLVSHALSYITQSKNGISDLEMEDLLSLDDVVLNDVYQYWTPPTRRLPPLLWIRIKTELGSYIVSRGADGVRVNTWYHRQFIETARERYLSNAENVTQISKSLGEYFLGTWAARDKEYLDKIADRLVAKQPLMFTSDENREKSVYNLRKFSELPHSLIGAGMLDCLKENVLCNYDWLFNKLSATSCRDVINDFHAASETFPDDEELVLVLETLKLSANALAQDPAQLASQLVGRLLDKLHECGTESMINTRRLVFEQAHKPAQPALVPDRVFLIPPGGRTQLTIKVDTRSSKVYLTRDRKRIISASDENTLKIFDARYGHVIRNMQGVVTGTKYFRVNITEEYGVTSGSGLIQVWKMNTGQKLYEFNSSENVSPIGLINDDVVAIMDGKLDVYNFRTGKPVRSFKDPRLRQFESWHNLIACHSSGDLVAYSRDKENTVNILNYKTCVILHVVTLSDLKCVHSMSVSPSGLVYVAGYYRPWILSFELTTGHNVRLIRRQIPGRFISSLQATRDAKYLVITMKRHVEVWNLETDKVLYNLKHSSILNSVSLGSQGHILVTADFDYLLKLYDLRRVASEDEGTVLSWQRINEYFVAPSPFVEKPNTRYNVLRGLRFWNYIAIWDNVTGMKVKEIQGNFEVILMIDDRRALISTKNQLKILDLPSATVTRAISGRCSHGNGKDNRVLIPGLLNQEQVLAVSSRKRHLKIMSLTTGELVKVLKNDSIGGLIESLLISRNGSTAVAFKDRGVAEVWDISTCSCKVLQGVCKDDDRQFSDISDDGQLLAYIDRKSTKEEVRVFDLTEASVKFSLLTTEYKITCVSIATATRRVLTGSPEHCLSVWDLDTGNIVHQFSDYNYEKHGFTLSRDCSRVLTSSLRDGGEQSMRVYDIVKGKFLAAFTSEESWPCKSVFHYDNNDAVLYKPSLVGIVKFHLSSGSRKPEIIELREQVDWGKISVTMNDSTSYQDDGDHDQKPRFSWVTG